MPLSEPKIQDAVQEIKAAAVARLAGRRAAGQTLEGVQTVVSGERVRISDVKQKMIWVNVASWNKVPEESTTFITVYDLRLVFTAVVRRRNDPADSATESQWYANSCISEIMLDDAGQADPTLGLAYVEDTNEERGEMSAGPTNDGLSGSASQVIVRFRASRF